MKLTNSQLKRQLDRLAKANNIIQEATTAIEEYCMEVYGYTPGDIDNDEFIDSFGGCGKSEGMSVEEFKASMERK